jgi:hypothetical protein
MPFDLSHMTNDEIIQRYKEIMSNRIEKYEKYSNITYINDAFEKNRETSLILNKN